MEKMEDRTETNTPMNGLFEKGAHFGYSPTRRHPTMEKFVFGYKNNVEIIDLEQTISRLDVAREFARLLGKTGGQLLFVGSKAESKQPVQEAAQIADQPYVVERWIGGTITNYPEMKKRLARLEKLEEEEQKGELAVYTKKERLLFEREKNKLIQYFGGVRNLKGAPAGLFIVDPKHQNTAVREALKKNIPIIALVNTDCDISNITYPIPGNDSSKETVRYVASEIAGAYKEGRNDVESE